VKRYVSWGVGPRGAQAVVHASKVRAMLQGRDRANLDDVRALAIPAFRHRLVLNFRGEAEGETPEGIIGEILDGGAGERRRTTVAAGGDRRRTARHGGRVARR
jgi:MoxR-like ATPase